MKHSYKKILVVFFFSLQFSFLNAQWATIPDVNFVSWLNANGFAACMNGNLMDTTCSSVISIPFMNLWNQNIYDLTGISYFDNLTQLNCGSNHLTSIPPLPNLLTSFSCDHNQLTSLPALPNGITFLFCEFNQLTSLPQLPVSLIHLYCNNNQLASLPVLGNSIVNIICDVNQLTSLPALPASLNFLTCDNNQLTSLPALQAVTILSCNSNLITSLPALPNTLTSLSCGSNLLTSLPPLPYSLLSLGCDGNQLTTLPPLPITLESLVCGFNQLTSLPELPSTLTTLFCEFNQLTSLPELPDSLDWFMLMNNPSLLCLPEIKYIGVFTFPGTGISCLPNYGNVPSSTPLLATLPLCDLFNANGCAAYWNISGKVYNDANSNCIGDTSELKLSNLKLTLDSSGTLIQQTYTGGEGFYSFDVGTGTYTYTVDTTGLPVLVTCPPSGFHTSVLTALDSMDYGMDFGMQCKPGFDVGVNCVVRDSGLFFPAHFALVNITAGDMTNFFGLSCAAGTSGMVQVILSGPVSYTGASAGSLIPVVSGDTLLYAIADFGTVNFYSDFSFTLQTDTTAPVGSQVCFDVNVLPIAGDINPANNSLQHCFTVVNSVDPNMKEVFPEGNIDTSQHWLTYTVHFQNTGTAPAEHIYILDTLDNDLDESSFTLLSYSHQPLTQVMGKVVRFNFPNINLADSTNDEPNSHGYVQFKVKLKTGLTNGTLIHNTANIYFDFNPPVTTNTTENMILITTNLTPNPSPKERRVQVVPNPAHDEVNIVFSSKDKFTIEIVNAIGKAVIKTEGQKRIDVSGLAKGIYFVKVFCGNNLFTEKFVKQ